MRKGGSITKLRKDLPLPFKVEMSSSKTLAGSALAKKKKRLFLFLSTECYSLLPKFPDQLLKCFEMILLNNFSLQIGEVTVRRGKFGFPFLYLFPINQQ